MPKVMFTSSRSSQTSRGTGLLVFHLMQGGVEFGQRGLPDFGKTVKGACSWVVPSLSAMKNSGPVPGAAGANCPFLYTYCKR